VFNWLLIGICVGMSVVAFQRPTLLEKWSLRPYKNRKEGQYFSLLSSGFIHANWTHLFFNMFTLFFFGPIVERALVYWYGLSAGGLIYLGFFLIAIVVSNISTFAKQKSNPAYSALGASGAVSAVLFASILIYPLEKVCFFAVLCIPGFLLAPVFLFYSHRAAKDPGSRINHEAHFYGAVFGMGFLGILKPSLFQQFFEQIIQFIVSL
jgi:membrane associated rhomboid family serine protease